MTLHEVCTRAGEKAEFGTAHDPAAREAPRRALAQARTQTLRSAAHLAGFLQRRCGVKRGDRVALFLHNSPQFILAYYAILRAEARVVPVNSMSTAAETP